MHKSQRSLSTDPGQAQNLEDQVQDQIQDQLQEHHILGQGQYQEMDKSGLTHNKNTRTIKSCDNDVHITSMETKLIILYFCYYF